MELRRTAAYRCLSCAKVWGGWVGPTDCPYCGSLYVKWANYDNAAIMEEAALQMTPVIKSLSAG